MSSVAPPSPQKALPVVSTEHSLDAEINYELFLDCVHCGLCTSACPTYLELGHEADSPRGRIYLMRAVTDGRLDLNAEVRRHLDLCLDCRACESACPSGVQYSKLIEPFRIQMARRKSGTSPAKTQRRKETLSAFASLREIFRTSDVGLRLSWLERLMLFHITPYAGRMRRLLAPVRWLQKIGMDRLIERLGLPRVLPRSLRQMHEMLPRLKQHYGRLPEVLPAEGPRRARVALFTGCAADAFFPETNLHTARVLQKNGCEVWIPRNQVCCGALHYHAARPEDAQQLAQTNIDLFSNSASSFDALIVNAAGCGAMFKEYGHLLNNRAAETLAAKVRDISEFLVELGPIKPEHPVPIRAVYHDACHLCHGQQIRRQPRQLLEMIPELKLLPLNETEVCCGAAGSYNLTEPEMAERLGQRKVENIIQADIDAVFAGNVGCLLQIGRYLRRQSSPVWVAHPIDALWASYSGELPEHLSTRK